MTISIPEAGKTYFGLSRNGSYAAAKRGEIPTIKLGKLLRVPIRALEAMLDSTLPPAGPARAWSKLRATSTLAGRGRLQLDHLNQLRHMAQLRQGGRDFHAQFSTDPPAAGLPSLALARMSGSTRKIGPMSESIITLPEIDLSLMLTATLGETQMHKRAAICKLHEIADYRLLGSGGWPASGESVPAFFRIIREFGLDEEIDDGLGSTRSTTLGDELSIDLMTMFAGCWEVYEIPAILADHGYIDCTEAEELCELELSNLERKLRFLAYRAYLDFCGYSTWLN
jgi:hypothetical protein